MTTRRKTAAIATPSVVQLGKGMFEVNWIDDEGDLMRATFLATDIWTIVWDGANSEVRIMTGVGDESLDVCVPYEMFRDGWREALGDVRGHSVRLSRMAQNLEVALDEIEEREGG